MDALLDLDTLCILPLFIKIKKLICPKLKWKRFLPKTFQALSLSFYYKAWFYSMKKQEADAAVTRVPSSMLTAFNY